MSKIIVLSNQDQIEVFIKKGLNAKDFQISCDDERTYELLKERGIDHEPLDEFLLKDLWGSINTWACQKAVAWIKLSKDSAEPE